jgi:putative hydrolase of the HAD superfamily
MLYVEAAPRQRPCEGKSTVIEAVLLDVGGVLMLPNPAKIHQALEFGAVRPSDRQLDEAHYRAVAATDTVGRFDWSAYRPAYVRSCGVREELVDTTVDALARLFTGYDWTRVAPGAISGLRRLTATGRPVGIVSNSMGTVAQMLAAAGVCQAGPGPLISVQTIVDSGSVHVEKPDPAIFRIALDRLGVPAEQAVYVGDVARIDVDGARRAGLRPLHFDPLGLCPDPVGDHEHVADLECVVGLVSEDTDEPRAFGLTQ